MVTLICSISQRMTRDGVKPNERMMETLERAYMLPCRRPILKVRKRTQLLLFLFFVFSLNSFFSSNGVLQCK